MPFIVRDDKQPLTQGIRQMFIVINVDVWDFCGSSVQTCAACHQPAAFFFDRHRYDREKDRHRTFFLEYDRGHLGDRSDWSEARKLAALLPPTFVWERQAFDRDEVIEGGEIVFREFATEYLRPDYLADTFWRIVDEQSGGYVHLVGPAGVGKTYFVRGLARDASARHVPLLVYHILPGAASQYQTFVTEFADQVKERFGIAGFQEVQTNVATTADLHRQFVRFIDDLMRRKNLDTLVLALDGLDELSAPEPHGAAITDLLPPADRLPRGCFVLLSSQETLRPKVAADLDRLRAGAPQGAESPAAAPVFTTLEVAPATPANREFVLQHLHEGERTADEWALRKDGTYASACPSRGRLADEKARHRLALDLLDRAAHVYGHLVYEEGHIGFRYGLALAIMNRGNAVQSLGRSGEALVAHDEAVGIIRRLVAEGWDELANDLAGALLNQGSALQGLGRLEEAAAGSNEAIDAGPGKVG